MLTKLKDAGRALRESWSHWIHALYAVLVIGSVVAADAAKSDTRGTIAYSFLFIYVLVLLALLLFFINAYSRKARYAEAMHCLHKVNHCTRDLQAYLDRCGRTPAAYDKDHFDAALTEILTHINTAFSIVTATTNRTCVKLLAGPANDQFLKTLRRDLASAIECKKADLNEGEEHKVSKNTEYQEIIASGEGLYYCEDLRKLNPGYRSTNLPGGKLGAQKWNYPYVAILIIPIRRFLAENEIWNMEPVSRIMTLGYLTIDSRARGAYNKRYDPDMAKAIADSLFFVLDTWGAVEARARSARTALVPPPTAPNAAEVLAKPIGMP